ncbi:MAG: hypothetical protein VX699_12720 [Myxococcota bacterium]|nr:hypothetical protein [Myxococcota bacterium]
MRPLGTIESSFALVHEKLRGGAMPGVVIHLKGRISFEELTEAFVLGRERTWVLQQRIETQGGRVCFSPSYPFPEGRQVLRESERTWITVAEDEINTPRDAGAGELLRGVLVTDENDPEQESELIMMGHHSVGDAASVLIFLHHILQYCGASEGREELWLGQPVPEEVPMPAPAESLNPWRTQGIKGWLAFGLWLLVDTYETLRWRPQPVVVQPGDALKTRTGLLYCELEERVLTELRRIAREKKCTVTGLLMACEAEAVGQELYGESTRPIRVVSAADLRSSAVGKPSIEILSCYIGGIRTIVHSTIKDTLWEAAAKISRELRQAVKRGVMWLVVPLVRLHGPLLVRLPSSVSAAVQTSNIGVCPIPPVVGSLRVRGVHCVLCANAIGRAVIFNTATFEGKLVFTFNYSEYHVTGEEAVNVANRAMQNLYRMAGLEAPERFVELG